MFVDLAIRRVHQFLYRGNRNDRPRHSQSQPIRLANPPETGQQLTSFADRRFRTYLRDHQSRDRTNRQRELDGHVAWPLGNDFWIGIVQLPVRIAFRLSLGGGLFSVGRRRLFVIRWFPSRTCQLADGPPIRRWTNVTRLDIVLECRANGLRKVSRLGASPGLGYLNRG